jgi:hypothetical protein
VLFEEKIMNDKVDIQNENGVYYILPCNDKKKCGISVSQECNYGDGYVHFELNDLDGIENAINKYFCKEQKSADVYRCYKRCRLEENELFGLNLDSSLKTTNPMHSIIYAKTKIPVERFQLSTNNFLLPNFPLFQNDERKELWEPCCNLLHIRAKADDYSLDSDDDSNFLCAVLWTLDNDKYDELISVLENEQQLENIGIYLLVC